MSSSSKRMRNEQPYDAGDCCRRNCDVGQHNITKDKELSLSKMICEEFSQPFFIESEETVDFVDKQKKIGINEADETILDVPLLSQSTYFLNKSNSKWVCTGLDVDLFFEPTVKIIGMKKQSISMNEEEWRRFTLWKCKIMKYFTDEANEFPILHNLNIRMTFGCFDGVNKILKLEKNGGCLYIAYEGLLELWRLQELIDSRLDNLKSIEYGKYYKELIDALIAGEGDLKENVEKVMNGTVSERVCITKELLVYGLRKMYRDVQLLKSVYV